MCVQVTVALNETDFQRCPNTGVLRCRIGNRPPQFYIGAKQIVGQAPISYRNNLSVQQGSVGGQLVEEGGCSCDELNKGCVIGGQIGHE